MSEENKNIDATQSLHTLEGDLLASMKNDNYASNIVKIVTHDKEEGKGATSNKTTDIPTVESKTPSKLKFSINFNSTASYIGISAFFIIFISAGSYYFIHKTIQNTLPVTPTPVTTSTSAPATTTNNTTKPQPILQANGIFSADMVIPIQISSFNKKALISKLDEVKNNLVKNNIKDKIDISLATDLNLDGFLDKLQYSGPETLLRSFDSDKTYNFGFYHVQGDQFEAYFLTKVDVFDLAFSGMLDWEKSMPLDFQDIYTYKADVGASGTTTKATSSAPKFTDKVIKNIDTRTYIDPKKGIQITYGIINKQYLLITSGENSFVDIVNKLLIRNVLH